MNFVLPALGLQTFHFYLPSLENGYDVNERLRSGLAGGGLKAVRERFRLGSGAVEYDSAPDG